LLKAAQGNLNVLNTTAKTSLVAAINEVLQLPRQPGLRLVQPLMILKQVPGQLSPPTRL
jgi:hypothetical protein